MTQTEVHEGECACRALRYRTTAAPKRVGACACRRRQRRTGSALEISIFFDKDDVTFIRGTPRLYGLTSDAGRWIESQFCHKCGTTVGSTLEFLPDYHGIAGGTFDALTF